MKRNQKYTSKCDGEALRKTAEELTKFYEAKGYQAERNKDYSEAHNYFQHAEHYKRIGNEQGNN